LSVALKPAGVERNAAARSGDDGAGAVESEHAAAVTTATPARTTKMERDMVRAPNGPVCAAVLVEIGRAATAFVKDLPERTSLPT
jgi:hypothetical protein